MSKTVISKDKVVSITYSIVNTQGEVLEQSDLNVSYVHRGPNHMFPEVEAALEGCAVGDKIDVTLTPDQAFGERDPSLAFTDYIKNVPEQFRHIGAEVQMQNEQGETRTFFVSEIKDGKLTVDCNHPFAGKTLTFTVTVVDIRDATDAEKAEGVSQSPVLH